MNALSEGERLGMITREGLDAIPARKQPVVELSLSEFTLYIFGTFFAARFFSKPAFRIIAMHS